MGTKLDLVLNGGPVVSPSGNDVSCILELFGRYYDNRAQESVL
jgi:hypothetical protein